VTRPLPAAAVERYRRRLEAVEAAHEARLSEPDVVTAWIAFTGARILYRGTGVARFR